MLRKGLIGFVVFMIIAAVCLDQVLAQDEGIKISQMVIAEGVENREPIGITDTFPASAEKAYCFIEATDIETDTEVTFVWYYEDKEVHSFTLPVKQGPRWRTFAYKNLRGQTGDWRVEVRDFAGNVLKSIGFRVE